MTSLCHSIKQEYESLKTLTAEFVSACEKAGGSAMLTPTDVRTVSAKDLNTLWLLKQKLETARDALKEKLNVIIHVKDATNPYREAFLASGIPNIETNPIAAERKDITINLRETIKKQKEYYKSMGLAAWADNIEKLNLSHLTPEKRRIIEQEVKDGAIPIVMPGRETQLNTTVEQFKTAFKPTLIKEGEEQKVKDAYLTWGHFINLINTKEVIPNKQDVPDHPYFSFIKPTQKPDDRTTNKIVERQLQEFVKINTERTDANQQPAHILSLHEYSALQTIHSRLVQEMLIDQPSTLNPIDTDTWTRFINLKTAGGGVPGASWYPGDSRARFGWDGARLRDAGSGFRLAVRVEV